MPGASIAAGGWAHGSRTAGYHYHYNYTTPTTTYYHFNYY
jgi:hypothetical protein